MKPLAKVCEKHCEKLFSSMDAFDATTLRSPITCTMFFNSLVIFRPSPLSLFVHRPAKDGIYKLIWDHGLEGYFRTWDNHVLSAGHRVDMKI